MASEPQTAVEAVSLGPALGVDASGCAALSS
jgi:hypothetical protein